MLLFETVQKRVVAGVQYRSIVAFYNYSVDFYGHLRYLFLLYAIDGLEKT